MDNSEKMVLVIIAQLETSLIPRLKCAVTVLKDSDLTLLPLPVTVWDNSIKQSGTMLLKVNAIHVLMVNILSPRITPVQIVHTLIIGGLMKLLECAKIAQLILIGINLLTLVSHVLRAKNINELR
jgi:hypothetical protein